MNSSRLKLIKLSLEVSRVLLATVVFFCIFSMVGSRKVNADTGFNNACGDTTGNAHHYASVLITVYGVKYGQTALTVVNETNNTAPIGIIFDTTNFTSAGSSRAMTSGGNLYNMSTKSRLKKAGFIANKVQCFGAYGFALNSNVENVAIPDGSRGIGDWIPGKWVLDCDSSHPPLGELQRFNISMNGTPDGFRAGGRWELQVYFGKNASGKDVFWPSPFVAPGNGTLTQARMVYYEPAPIPQPNKYNLTPSVIVDSENRKVTFSVNNNGDGESRKDDDKGVKITTKIWKKTGTQPSDIFYNQDYNNVIIAGYENRSLGIIDVSGNLNTGDRICALISVTPIAGVTGGAVTNSGTAVNSVVYSSCGNPPPTCAPTDPACCPINPMDNPGISCDSDEIVAKPYLRVYGNDVVVGRQFIDPSGTCGSKNASATITAFAKQNIAGYYVGAGSQFAVSSAGQIVKFLSADMHDDGTAYAGGEVTKPYNSLMLSNAGNTPNTYMGNDSNGYTGCLPDYNKFVADNDSTFYKPSSGDQTIDDITDISDNSTYNRIYVDGDLNIDGNIEDTTSSYSSLGDFKPVIVIVNGNINIRGSVSQLDGLYVALPKKDGLGNIVGGTINTCSDTGDTPTVSACDNKLTINGSFVANKVLFNRLKGDIASAIQNEASGSDNIAESFVFTSDLYFGLMGIQDTTDANIKTPGTQYESIVGLPPVLQ